MRFLKAVFAPHTDYWTFLRSCQGMKGPPERLSSPHARRGEVLYCAGRCQGVQVPTASVCSQHVKTCCTGSVNEPPDACVSALASDCLTKTTTSRISDFRRDDIRPRDLVSALRHQHWARGVLLRAPRCATLGWPLPGTNTAG